MTDYLLALANDNRLTAQHVSLLVAIVANHLSTGGAFDAHRLSLMKQAKIRRKDTYIALVHDLHEFEYILYEPGHRFKPTRITAIMPRNETDEQPIIPISETHPTGISRNYETDDTAIVPIIATDDMGNAPTLEHELSNHNADNQVLKVIIPNTENDDPARQSPSSTSKQTFITTKYDSDDDVAGSRRKTARSADNRAGRTASGRINSNRTQNQPADTADVLFAETEFYDLDCFKAAFANDPKFAGIDLEHYHEALKDWRDRHTGQPPRRTNWIGTARTFIRNDRAAGKLVTLTLDADSPPPTTSHATEPNAIIDRSKYQRDRPGKPGI